MPSFVRSSRVWTLLFTAVLATACGGSREAPVAPRAVLTSAAPMVAAREAALAAAPEHWYFEWLSPDGNRALLRRLDGDARSTLQTRVVDVNSGATLAEATFPELGKVPVASIGRKPNEVSELFGRLTSPAFGDELVRGARIAEEFPFGTCGRFSTSPQGGGIAFNAGDWLYIADENGRVQRRLTAEAAYDPRFTPDGKHLLFRRQTGTVDKVRARYELFALPTDLSGPPKALAGTAGARDRFAIDAEGRFAIAVASQEPYIKTCVLSVALRSPFAVKKLGCIDGGEQLVESVLSPHGRWAALTTMTTPKGTSDLRPTLAWRLRVLSLESGKVVLDEAEQPGMMVRAISDEGLLVHSGAAGIVLSDVPEKTRRSLSRPFELGHRGFFRNATELVVVQGGAVAVVDLALQ